MPSYRSWVASKVRFLPPFSSCLSTPLHPSVEAAVRSASLLPLLRISGSLSVGARLSNLGQPTPR